MGLLASGEKSFKQANSFEERQKLAGRMLKLHSDKVPIICEPMPDSNLTYIDNPLITFHLPKDTTWGEFQRTMHIRLKGHQGSVGFRIQGSAHNHKLETKLGELYSKYKENDGFMYVKMWNIFIN
eukprot:411018_1